MDKTGLSTLKEKNMTKTEKWREHLWTYLRMNTCDYVVKVVNEGDPFTR